MKRISEVTKVILTLSQIKGVGDATLKKIKDLDQNYWSNIDIIIEKIDRLKKITNADEQAIEKATAKAETQISYLDDNSYSIISFLDEEYPYLLRECIDAPAIIFIKGTLPANLLQGRSVSVIGTRKPTAHGEVITQRITEFLSENDFCIVSGLALGCDSIAHKTSLEKGATTVAVLAHGLHTIAPKSNTDLANEMVKSGGALVSEYPFGVDPIPPYFVRRDRIQAAMSSGVVMVQSDLEGGSLHAVRAAVKYDRWVAVPYPTKLDVSNDENKIAANMKFAVSEPQDIAKFLECSDENATKIKMLYSKSDYEKILEIKPSSIQKSSRGMTDDLF